MRAFLILSLIVHATAAEIPLCPGLTVVTAIQQPDGDYESIKSVESIQNGVLRLKYSSERMYQDLFSAEPPKLQKTSLFRNIPLADLESASLYLQQFYDKLPAAVPGTTALGVSSRILRDLKTKGQATFSVFNAFNGEPSISRDDHPNVYDFGMEATISRAGTATLPLMVNGVLRPLPVIHARGDFFSDRAEFFFLDDEANPLALRYRIGIGAVDAARFADGKPGEKRDRDTLQVVKITHRCDTGQLGSTTGRFLERILLEQATAEIHDIYFTFNSDQIREESEGRLREIAEVLRKHPDWRLRVEGHTDSIAADAYNLDLARRRAAAVKNALVTRYKIAANRLSTAGYGESRPKAPNDTLEGRARNRRVELARVSALTE